jgi:hypothetical protein
VIQILKKATMLASEAEARRGEAWPSRGPGTRGGVRGAEPPAVRIVLGFHLYKYLCKPQEIIISIVKSPAICNHPKIVRSCWPAPVVFSPSL